MRTSLLHKIRCILYYTHIFYCIMLPLYFYFKNITIQHFYSDNKPSLPYHLYYQSWLVFKWISLKPTRAKLLYKIGIHIIVIYTIFYLYATYQHTFYFKWLGQTYAIFCSKSIHKTTHFIFFVIFFNFFEQRPIISCIRIIIPYKKCTISLMCTAFFIK